jgi:hypothetical protein
MLWQVAATCAVHSNVEIYMAAYASRHAQYICKFISHEFGQNQNGNGFERIPYLYARKVAIRRPTWAWKCCRNDWFFDRRCTAHSMFICSLIDLPPTLNSNTIDYPICRESSLNLNNYKISRQISPVQEALNSILDL